VVPPIDIAYAAHTSSCTFLLDSEGICRRIVMQPKGKRRESSRTSVRCVGAQYVASVDGSATGGLVEMPRVGAAMLFARVDERGRVSLVRTGTITAFESYASEDPFVESRSVETSIPDFSTPRAQKIPRAEDLLEPDYDDDPSDRTLRIHALRPEELAEALGQDMATAEYHAAHREDDDEAPQARAANLGPSATLRNPHREIVDDDQDDDYARSTLAPAPLAPNAASAARGMLPRRSDPRAYKPEARPASPPPPAYASDVQVARRKHAG
jgi:hypothetical protein